jgi:hypothetical protein
LYHLILLAALGAKRPKSNTLRRATILGALDLTLTALPRELLGAGGMKTGRARRLGLLWFITAEHFANGPTARERGELAASLRRILPTHGADRRERNTRIRFQVEGPTHRLPP